MKNELITAASLALVLLLSATGAAGPDLPRSSVIGPAAFAAGAAADETGLIASIGQGVIGQSNGDAVQIRAGIVPALLPPPSSGCAEDLSGDGAIDSADLNLLLAAFGSSAAGDVDGDDDTDSADLNLLLALFGDACPA